MSESYLEFMERRYDALFEKVCVIRSYLSQGGTDLQFIKETIGEQPKFTPSESFQVLLKAAEV